VQGLLLPERGNRTSVSTQFGIFQGQGYCSMESVEPVSYNHIKKQEIVFTIVQEQEDPKLAAENFSGYRPTSEEEMFRKI
jgi:hypothetical protein